jgi:hypothetical protein
LIHIYTINIEFLTNDIDSLIIFSLTFMRESTGKTLTEVLVKSLFDLWHYDPRIVKPTNLFVGYKIHAIS